MAGKKPPERARRGKPAAPSSLHPYKVDMTATAEAAYKAFGAKSQAAIEKDNPTNSHCTTFHMIRHAIREIIPAIAVDRRYALEGHFSNIFRLKKGRLRICWIASSERRRVIILFISETLRKEGDVNDPYEMFGRMLASGEYDGFFADLGVKIPRRTAPFPLRIQ